MAGNDVDGPFCHRPLLSFKSVGVYIVEHGETSRRSRRLGFVDTEDDPEGAWFFLPRLRAGRLSYFAEHVSQLMRSDGRDVIRTRNLLVTLRSFLSRV